jgi:glutathione synthase/RimK-type ligase-like ATP-grasp enzyme
MAHILFVTCDTWPLISISDNLIAEKLRVLGHCVDPAPWQGNFELFRKADLIILRSNWDYHYDVAGFTTWLDQLTTSALPVYNPLALVRWNLQKRYLLDLQAQGIRIPASAVLQAGGDPRATYQQYGWPSAVIKPLVGASGHLVERVAFDDLDEWKLKTRSQRPDEAWLLQEFIPAIQTQGELSLVFVDGVFSHAVRKLPQAGEFRINSQYQGVITLCEPAPTIVDQAQKVLAGLSVMPLYARVDGVVDNGHNFCLIELELNEPGLYFDLVPEKAMFLAEAIDQIVA